MLGSELKSLLVWAHRLLRKQATVSADEIPHMYHEVGVLTGYRVPGQSIFTYVLSALQMNNETVNIWTHLIGFFVILFRTLSLLEEFGADDARIFPLVGFGVCCMLYTGLSVTAHTFHNASPSLHYTCFQADYAGIGLYAFGGALPVFYLSVDDQTRMNFNSWFLPVNFVFSWFCFLCCCIAKLKHHSPYSRQRKVWQILPFGLHMSMLLALLYRRVSKCYFESDVCDDPGLDAYKKSILLAVVTAMTFSCHLPEKIWPGRFDFIGHGHHVFHVISIVLTLSQFNAAYTDILHSRQNATQGSIPSLSCLLGAIAGLCICSVITVVFLRPTVLDRIRADEMLEKRNN